MEHHSLECEVLLNRDTAFESQLEYVNVFGSPLATLEISQYM
jgi:hypothetical protein